MKFSVVTPSLNQGRFIEQTIQSVLNQAGCEVEHIVIDGGSFDGTIEILKKYDSHISWISEQDEGQSDAINKGLRMASGEILCYLNSDDYFLPGALQKVARVFREYPDVQWISGNGVIIDENNLPIHRLVSGYKNFLRHFHSQTALYLANYIIQPGAFWRRSILEEFGSFNLKLKYAMDYDYWIRIYSRYSPYLLQDEIAAFRIQADSKGRKLFRDQFAEELEVLRNHCSSPLLYALHWLHNQLIVAAYKLLK